jgi:hypothetical protein
MRDCSSGRLSSRRRLPFQIVGNGRQRLVELVRQGRGHLAHGGEARDVHQLRLQFLQPRLGLLALAQVADEAGEEALAARVHLPDRQLHGERGAVLALSHHHPADADDAPLAGLQIAPQIAVMLLAVGRRHQHAHVAPDRLLGAVAGQPLRRGAERLHDAGLVDHDHGVGNRVEDRLQVLGACRGATAFPQQALAEPGHADPEHAEGKGAAGLLAGYGLRGRGRHEHEAKARHGRKQPRAEPPENP